MGHYKFKLMYIYNWYGIRSWIGVSGGIGPWAQVGSGVGSWVGVRMGGVGKPG